MERHFQTPNPTRLDAVFGAGRIQLRATARDTTDVVITGPGARETTVRELGGTIVIATLGRPGLFGRDGLEITVDLPTGSDLKLKTGAGEVVATGEFGAVSVQTGSGPITLERSTKTTNLDSGSWKIRLDDTTGKLRVRSGAGDVAVGAASGDADVSAGSGDIALGSVTGKVRLKSGSGDLRVEHADAEMTVTLGSGKFDVGSITNGKVIVAGGAGEIRIGVPDGVPVSTNITNASGRVTSELAESGKPDPGQEHVEIRIYNGNGDITLTPV